jgi:hypothetical protein
MNVPALQESVTGCIVRLAGEKLHLHLLTDDESKEHLVECDLRAVNLRTIRSLQLWTRCGSGPWTCRRFVTVP